MTDMPPVSPVMERRATRLLGLCVAALWTVNAHAALGGDAASVASDAARLGSAPSSASQPLYTRLQIDDRSGVRLREFLGLDGVVFAVSWSGPVQPDLQPLLGTHYADYAAAQAAVQRPGLRRELRLTLPGAVVETGGHLRAYAGRAYLPQRIPAGITLADLN